MSSAGGTVEEDRWEEVAEGEEASPAPSEGGLGAGLDLREEDSDDDPYQNGRDDAVEDAGDEDARGELAIEGGDASAGLGESGIPAASVGTAPSLGADEESEGEPEPEVREADAADGAAEEGAGAVGKTSSEGEEEEEREGIVEEISSEGEIDEEEEVEEEAEEEEEEAEKEAEEAEEEAEDKDGEIEAEGPEAGARGPTAGPGPRSGSGSGGVGSSPRAGPGGGSGGQEQMLFVPGLGYVPLSSLGALGRQLGLRPPEPEPEARATGPEPERPWTGLTRMPAASREQILAALEVAAERLDAEVEDELFQRGVERVEDEVPRTLNVLVVGLAGVGKSALVNSLLGEPACATHAFAHDGPIEAPVLSRVVPGGVAGHRQVIRFIDAPGLLDADLADGELLELACGSVGAAPPDAVLLVARLDVAEPDDLDAELAGALTDALGSALWDRAALVLTRATRGEQPEGLGFAEWVEERAEQVRDSVRAAVARGAAGKRALEAAWGADQVRPRPPRARRWGAAAARPRGRGRGARAAPAASKPLPFSQAFLPVFLAENGSACPTDDDGQKLVPAGWEVRYDDDDDGDEDNDVGFNGEGRVEERPSDDDDEGEDAGPEGRGPASGPSAMVAWVPVLFEGIAALSARTERYVPDADRVEEETSPDVATRAWLPRLGLAAQAAVFLLAATGVLGRLPRNW